jgi:shikimate dehydrogenase
MHNVALKHAGLDWTYCAIRVSDAEIDLVPALLTLESFMGANVTVPHKILAQRWCTHLDESAAAMGSVNTLVRTNGAIKGFNTDLPGFLDGLSSANVSIPEKALILGTGGTSRMVQFALARAGCKNVLVFSRQTEEGLLSYELIGEHIKTAGLLVNCTPKGMWPDVHERPLDLSGVETLEHLTVYDLIYRPFKTRLLLDAESKGARIITGLEMFIGQGARAYALWTGKTFQKEVAYQLLLPELTKI